jgi:hypothetical protein
MKTRELLHCDYKTFGVRIAHLKPKELYRHMDRIAADLGEPDLEALLRSAIDGLFVGGTMPESSGEEMDRVFDAIGKHIVPTEENADTVMRLLALLVTFLRLRVKEATRERRLAERAPTGHRHGEGCTDPSCTEHSHDHNPGVRPQTDLRPLARGIRHAIAD